MGWFFCLFLCLVSLPVPSLASEVDEGQDQSRVEIDKCDVLGSLGSYREEEFITELEYFLIIDFIKKNIHLLDRHKVENFFSLSFGCVIGGLGGALITAHLLRDPSALLDTQYLGGFFLGGVFGGSLAYYTINRFIVKKNQALNIKISQNKVVTVVESS